MEPAMMCIHLPGFRGFVLKNNSTACAIFKFYRYLKFSFLNILYATHVCINKIISSK